MSALRCPSFRELWDKPCGICYSNYFTDEDPQAHSSARLCAKPHRWKQWESPGLRDQDPGPCLPLLPAEMAPRPACGLSSGISVLEKFQQHLLLWGKKETELCG